MGTYTVVDTDKGNFICLRLWRILEGALYLVQRSVCVTFTYEFYLKNNVWISL